MYKKVTKKKFVRFQYLLKLHNKATYGASGFCKNYTRKTPLYIYYIISTGADAACVFLATCYTVIVPMRCGTQERGTERQQNEPDAMRRAFTLAVLPPLAQRGNTGQRIHCKGDEQTEIRLQVLYCGRGDCRRASAIRAYKVKRRPPACAGGTFQKVYDLLTIIIN